MTPPTMPPMAPLEIDCEPCELIIFATVDVTVFVVGEVNEELEIGKAVNVIEAGTVAANTPPEPNVVAPTVAGNQ